MAVKAVTATFSGWDLGQKAKDAGKWGGALW